MTDNYSDWTSGMEPLQTDWSLYFQNPALGPKSQPGWYNTLAPPIYGAVAGQNGYTYDPAGGGMGFDPYSTLSGQMIAGDIQNSMRWNESDWMAWTGTVNENVGLVAQSPDYGQFSQDPAVYGEIQKAAQKYGVPANFLQVILAREGSGDWVTNNAKGSFPVRDSVMTPYTGVFKEAADQRVGPGLYEQSIGNRALQIEILAGVLRSQYEEIRKKDQSYGWLQVAAYHYSGDPSGQYTPPDSTRYYYTSDYVAQTEKDWKMLDQQSGNIWSNVTSSSGNVAGAGPLGSPNNQKWAPFSQFDSYIKEAAAKYGVPANLMKAVLSVESPGGEVTVSPAGATGPMQVMPDIWNGSDGWNVHDTRGNFMLGAYVLNQFKTTYGSWEMAAKAYLGLVGTDDFGTDANSYWRKVKTNWDELNAAGSGVYGGIPTGVQSKPGTDNMAAIFGGVMPAMGQEFGPTEWSMGKGAWMYDYSLKLGFNVPSHPGLDIPVPMRTQVWFPLSGTVEYVGSDNGFADTEGGGVGQIRIRLSNGDSVIYGHMNTSAVQVGQQIGPGTLMGGTGGMNGPHLHLEYRTPDPSTISGERAVDPRGPFNGDFSGSYGGGGVSGQVVQTGPGYTLPLTYHNIMMGLMMGKTLPFGTNGTFGTSSDNPFRNHLLSIMRGTYNQDSTLSRAQALGFQGRNSIVTPTTTGGPFSNTSTSNKNLKTDGAQIVAIANTYLETPYVWGSHTPAGWDCSGFTGWFYQNKLGIDIGYGSHEQFNMGQAVDKSQLQIGDLVFFSTTGEFRSGNSASHVGMYIGNGQMIHAANPSVGTITSDLSDPYYSGKYLGARRYG